jgi:type IV pilus assembly protein PilV
MDRNKNGYSETQRGVTLLEVLIALLVLSIGLLGLAALQTRAVRFSQMADMHNRAVLLVRDISERMRGNPAGVQAGEYTLARGQSPATTAGLALADLQTWRRRVAGLPAGVGEIVPCTLSTPVTCPDMDGHIVTVYWNAARDPATRSFNCPPRSAADFRCYRQLAR